MLNRPGIEAHLVEKCMPIYYVLTISTCCANVQLLVGYLSICLTGV